MRALKSTRLQKFRVRLFCFTFSSVHTSKLRAGAGCREKGEGNVRRGNCSRDMYWGDVWDPVFSLCLQARKLCAFKKSESGLYRNWLRKLERKWKRWHARNWTECGLWMYFWVLDFFCCWRRIRVMRRTGRHDRPKLGWASCHASLPHEIDYYDWITEVTGFKN